MWITSLFSLRWRISNNSYPIRRLGPDDRAHSSAPGWFMRHATVPGKSVTLEKQQCRESADSEFNTRQEKRIDPNF